MNEYEKYAEIERLAALLPSGLIDQKAMDKYNREFAELQEELRKGDKVGALLEAADCLYYAQKAYATNILSYDQRDNAVEYVLDAARLHIDTVLDAAIAKYTLRARPGNPKNDAEERAAVAHLI